MTILQTAPTQDAILAFHVNGEGWYASVSAWNEAIENYRQVGLYGPWKARPTLARLNALAIRHGMSLVNVHVEEKAWLRLDRLEKMLTDPANNTR